MQLLISAQGFVPVCRRTGSAHLAEYSSKVLLGFEAAGDGNIQDPHFGGTQHLLRSLDSIPQETLVRSLTRRVAEDFRKMRGAEPNCTRHFLKTYILLHFLEHQFFNLSQSRGAQSTPINSDTIVTHRITDDQSPGKCLLDRVEKKTSARETCGSFHVHCRGQRTQSRIHEFVFEAQFYSALGGIRGGHQSLVGNGHGYMCHITRADPVLRLGWTQSQHAGIERNALEGRTS